jgi:hypothetical protein|tara:strand:+ start:7 stop:375 length:369 start_codon:yes stop_codon:yes gene_type:complete
MANDFKRFAKPSVGTSTGASADAVYTVPAGAGSTALESIIIGITLANKSSSGVTASVFLDNEDGSNDVFIVKDATIPAGSSLEVMAGNKIVVQNDGSNADVVRVSCSTGSSLDALITVLEDV